MGVITREKVKGSGQWWVFLSHNGTRKSKLVGDKGTALQVAKELRKRIAEGDFDIGKKEVPTFERYAEKWITVTVPATCKESTLKDYQAILANHILPVVVYSFLCKF